VKDREKDLHDKIKALKDHKTQVEQSIERSKRQKEILDGLSQQFSTAKIQVKYQNINLHGKTYILKKFQPCSEEKITPTTALLTNGESLNHLGRFLEFYGEKSNEIDKSLFNLDKDLEKVDEELDVVENQLSNMGGHGYHHIKYLYNCKLKNVIIRYVNLYSKQ